jgi:hypothetical protein
MGTLTICRATITDGTLTICRATNTDGNLTICRTTNTDGNLTICTATNTVGAISITPFFKKLAFFCQNNSGYRHDRELWFFLFDK